jgi:acyl carrier protein
MSDNGSDLLTPVTALVGQVADLPADSLCATSRFTGLGNWSSLAALRLLTLIEERLQVRLDLREYFATTDLGGLAALVARTRDAHLAA